MRVPSTSARRFLGACIGLASILGLFVAVRGGLQAGVPKELAPYARQMDEEVVRAVAAQDWTAVARKLGSVTPANGSPTARMIKAHACLALNRNDDSLALFHSVATPEGRREWDGWSRWFVAASPRAAAAHYLRGDALARQSAWKEAAASFNRALELAPGTPLSLGARGVMNATRGHLDPALVDLEEAAQRGGLADLNCSRGVLTLQSLHNREGAKSALADFNRALELSPGYGPALIGRGCARFITGERAQAYRDFQQAGEKAAWLRETARQNIDLAAAYVGGDRRLAFLPPHDLGMEVERRMSDFVRNPNGGTAKELENAMGAAISLGGDAARNKFATELQMQKRMHPESSRKIDQLIAEQTMSAHKDAQGNYWAKDIKVAGGAAGMSGELSIGGLKVNEMKIKQAQEREQIWGGFAKANANSAKDPSGLGGAWLGVDGASVDGAKWPPFRTVYGLLYPASVGTERGNVR